MSRPPPTAPTSPPPSAPVGSPGDASPASGAEACTHIVVTSETVATSPADRARTRIGVGEEVVLTASPAASSWTVNETHGSLSAASGATTTFTAKSRAGTATITVRSPGCCDATFTLQIVRPSRWIMRRKPGGNLEHTFGHPDCGFHGRFYLKPADVNFYRVEMRELDSTSTATGSYSNFAGSKHGNYPAPDFASDWLPAHSHSAVGTRMSGQDHCYSGYPARRTVGSAPPFVPGTQFYPITIQWHVVGRTSIFDLPVTRQEHEIFATGRCESRKGGLNEATMWNDPTAAP